MAVGLTAGALLAATFAAAPPVAAAACSPATGKYISDFVTQYVFTAAQSGCTWTIPAGAKRVDMILVGGGGGGSAGNGRNRVASETLLALGGNGGGGGAVRLIADAAVTSGTTLTITTGAGGAGAPNSGDAGSNGTATTVAWSTTSESAPGGLGGEAITFGASWTGDSSDPQTPSYGGASGQTAGDSPRPKGGVTANYYNAVGPVRYGGGGGGAGAGTGFAPGSTGSIDANAASNPGKAGSGVLGLTPKGMANGTGLFSVPFWDATYEERLLGTGGGGGGQATTFTAGWGSPDGNGAGGGNWNLPGAAGTATAGAGGGGGAMTYTPGTGVSAGGNGGSGSVLIRVETYPAPAEPTIVTPPTNQTAVAGTQATFTVVAQPPSVDGSPVAGTLTYEWKCRDLKWAVVGTGSTWSPTVSMAQNGYVYAVTVKFTETATGLSSYAYSSNVTLTVTEPAPAPDNGGGGGSSQPEPAATPTPTPTSTQDPTPAVEPLDPIGGAQNPNIPAGGLQAGGSVFMVNGQPAPLTLQPNASSRPTGLVASGDGWIMRLQGRGGANDPLGLTSQQALVLESQELQRTRSVAAKQKAVQPSALSSGTGFKPNSQVKFYILPNIYMGSLATDASGNYEGRVPVPAGVPVGVHTMQVNGYAPDDAVRSLSLGVLVRLAETKVRTVQAGATVLFAADSAALTEQGKAALRALVQKTGKDAVKVASVGFVQKSGSSSNNQSLSTTRAKAVGAYLRGLGVKGAYSVRGDGVGGPAAKDRKVVVTVTYRK